MSDGVYVDHLANADFILDTRHDTFACPTCASPEPARLDDGGCSDCREYPRCYLCRRWTFDDEVLVSMAGAVRGVCSVCWERGQDEIEIPLDMTEDREGWPEFNGAFG